MPLPLFNQKETRKNADSVINHLKQTTSVCTRGVYGPNSVPKEHLFWTIKTKKSLDDPNEGANIKIWSTAFGGNDLYFIIRYGQVGIEIYMLSLVPIYIGRRVYINRCLKSLSFFDLSGHNRSRVCPMGERSKSRINDA